MQSRSLSVRIWFALWLVDILHLWWLVEFAFFSTLNTSYSFRFWCPWRFAVSLLFRSRFSVLGKNKIGFSGFLFDAVWSFSGFFSESIRLNDRNRVHVLSGFACGYRFCGFPLLFVGFCRFLYTPMPLSLWFCDKSSSMFFSLVALNKRI